MCNLQGVLPINHIISVSLKENFRMWSFGPTCHSLIQLIEVSCMRATYHTCTTTLVHYWNQTVALHINRRTHPRLPRALLSSPQILSNCKAALPTSSRCTMRRARADEADQTVAGSEDAPAVVAAGAGQTSPGTERPRRRARTVSSSVVVADEDQREDKVAVEDQGEDKVAVEDTVDGIAVAPAADQQEEAVAGGNDGVPLHPYDQYEADLDDAAISIFDELEDDVPFQEESEHEYTEVMLCCRQFPIPVITVHIARGLLEL